MQTSRLGIPVGLLINMSGRIILLLLRLQGPRLPVLLLGFLLQEQLQPSLHGCGELISWPLSSQLKRELPH